MLASLLLIIAGTVPRDDVLRESTDLVELNHFYDDCGKLVFDQTIFYDWHPAESRYHVRAWRLTKQAGLVPLQVGPKGWVCRWQDGEQLRWVWSHSFRETWTQYDPELAEREILPKERRRELRTVRYDKPSGAIRPASNQ